MNQDIVEIIETTDVKMVNDYISKLGWILLQSGTKFDDASKSLTIYYAIGRTQNTSGERW